MVEKVLSMGIRHKRVVSTLDTGGSADWNDDHIHDFTDEITNNLLIFGPAITVDWDTAQTAGGSAPVWALVSGHAFVVCNTGGVTDQISSMRHELGAAVANITNPDDLPILTCAVQVVAVHDAAGVANSVVEFGFQDDSDALFTQNLHHAIFRFYNGHVFAVTGDGAAETETDLGARTEFTTYRVEFTSTQVKFYIDDMVTAAATHTANLPTADLTVKFSVRSKNNVDSTIRVDAAGLTRLRQAS
jgi:hypothetical protein